jgi:hypothetical protein
LPVTARSDARHRADRVIAIASSWVDDVIGGWLVGLTNPDKAISD